MRSMKGTLAAAVCMTVASSARAADSDALVGVHFWGDRGDATPATMLDSVARGAWDLEIVNTANLQFGGWKDRTSSTRSTRTSETRTTSRRSPGWGITGAR